MAKYIRRDMFITGMARGVDIWAAEIVLKLRKEHGDIKLICASPYEGFEKSGAPIGRSVITPFGNRQI